MPHMPGHTSHSPSMQAVTPAPACSPCPAPAPSSVVLSVRGARVRAQMILSDRTPPPMQPVQYLTPEQAEMQAAQARVGAWVSEGSVYDLLQATPSSVLRPCTRASESYQRCTRFAPSREPAPAAPSAGSSGAPLGSRVPRGPSHRTVAGASSQRGRAAACAYRALRPASSAQKSAGSPQAFNGQALPAGSFDAALCRHLTVCPVLAAINHP